ncbi:MAG: radical SAM protein [Alteromonadaceae bacterium]|nr:radical SAM protein [Alteromonadaceae bacterium]
MNATNKSNDWHVTSGGEPRGYIQPGQLTELWFHTGTRCNLDCEFCLEGSSPGDKRLGSPTLDEIKPFIDQAINMGVEQFSFTGGEPFLVKDIIKMLDYASQHKPVLVLTNGTSPLFKRLDKLSLLVNNPYPISLRISLDHPDPERHDLYRGIGSFEKSIAGMRALHQLGFHISLARQMEKNEDKEQVEQDFRDLLNLNGLPDDLTIIAFPDFLTPGSLPDVPEISEHCMTHYQNEESRTRFMCSSSKMVVKRNGLMKIYACTLVDDDLEYELGGDLKSSQQQKISMKHHRCYSCFNYGASCSER